MIPPSKQELFKERLGSAREVVLTTHMNPDGDAIGSEIALALALEGREGSVRIINQDPTPRNLRFLERHGPRVEVFAPLEHGPLISAADLVVLVDNSAPDRLGRMEEVMRASADRVLCIDHHPTRETPWAWNILEVAACATTTLVYELLLASGLRPDPRVAEALFVGLATDTGFFRFNSATPWAYEIAAELIRAGAVPSRCFQEVYERNSQAYTRLLGQGLSALRLDASGRVASIAITLEMVQRFGAQAEDTSEMTTALLALDGVRIALLFRELDGGRVKVSLRSKGELDVRLLAADFGGGGHRNASGIVTTGGLPEVAEQVIARASELAATDS